MFYGNLSSIIKNLVVGGLLLVVGGTGGWLLHLERATANIMVEVAQDYVTNRDLDNLKNYMDEQFNRMERLIHLSPAFRNEQ